jgi:crotonobetainyl-CoA:carnitine CoA-transferase CaiB-like acyl-CoA transferase
MQHMAGEVVTGRPLPPMPAREGAWAIYEPFPTADGEQIFVGLTSNRQWQRFCEQFGRRDLVDDPAYRTNEDRVRARASLRPIVAAIIARHKRAELAELFDRIDIPFAPVAKPGDLFDDPQLNARGRMLDIEFGDGRQARLPRLPIEIGGHDLALRRQAPAIGEHTAEILAELGFARHEIAALATRGIIAVNDEASR